MLISYDYYTRNTEHWLKEGVNERETRFASGMERDRSNLSRTSAQKFCLNGWGQKFPEFPKFWKKDRYGNVLFHSILHGISGNFVRMQRTRCSRSTLGTGFTSCQAIVVLLTSNFTCAGCSFP